MSSPLITTSVPSVQPTYFFYYRGSLLFRGSLSAYFKRQTYEVKQVGPKVIVAGTAYDNLDAAYAALFPKSEGWSRRLTLAVFEARFSATNQFPAIGVVSRSTIPGLFHSRVDGVQVISGDCEYPHAVYVDGKAHGTYPSLKTIFDEFLGSKGWDLRNAIALDFASGEQIDDPAAMYTGEVAGWCASAVEFRKVSRSPEVVGNDHVACQFVELPTPQPLPAPPASRDATLTDAKEKVLEALKRHLTGNDDYGAGLLEAYRLLDA